MASVARLYARGFKKDFKFYYTHWLPSSTIELGTVGELEGGYLFRPKSTLRDLGIAFDADADVVADTSSSPLDFTSKSGVSITTKLAGEANTSIPSVPQGSAGIKLDFSREASFLIKAQESYEPRIRDLIGLERKILEKYHARQWDRNWVIVSSLVMSPYVDIVISESASSSIELEVSGSGTVQSVELGNVSLQFTMKRTSGKVLDMRGIKNCTPIFQLVGLKQRFLGGVHLGGVKGLALDAVGSAYETEDEAGHVYLDTLGGDMRDPLE